MLRNQAGYRQNSILLKLVGRASNRDGLGTLIEAHCGNQAISLEARCGGSYLSSHDPRIHIGMGDVHQIDELKLKWPAGTSQRITNLPAGYLYVISEEKGIDRQLTKQLANAPR